MMLGKIFLLNLSGFIGPEVYKNGDQLLRACLEDLVMAKLHGITMGLDVCSTFHMGINPFELEDLTSKIADLGDPAFLMAVAGKADPMLGYLTTAMKEHPRIRKKFNKRISSKMHQRLIELSILDENENVIHNDEEAISELYAKYMEADLDNNLSKEEKEKLHQKFIKDAKDQIYKMQEKGYDIGFSNDGDINNTKFENQRLQNIYINAVEALRAEIDSKKIKEITENKCIFIKSKSKTRDEYISHPESGEALEEESIEKIKELKKCLNYLRIL